MCLEGRLLFPGLTSPFLVWRTVETGFTERTRPALVRSNDIDNIGFDASERFQSLGNALCSENTTKRSRTQVGDQNRLVIDRALVWNVVSTKKKN